MMYTSIVRRQSAWLSKLKLWLVEIDVFGLVVVGNDSVEIRWSMCASAYRYEQRKVSCRKRLTD